MATSKPKKAKPKIKAKSSKTKVKVKPKARTPPKRSKKPAAKAHSKPKARLASLASAKHVETPRWHTWSSRPDELAVRDHVEAFFQAIHANDVQRAFTLCPIYTYGRPLLVGADNARAVKEAARNMRETLEGYDYLEADDAWHAHITPPSRVNYEKLNLAMPDNQGEVLANVFVDDEVTDATCILALLEKDEQWLLAFKMFKVM